MYKHALLASFIVGFTVFAGCSSEPDNTTGSGASSSSGGDPMPICTMPTTPIPCEDKVIQDMALKDNNAPGPISDAADGDGFWSSIDARAGGSMFTDSYVYGKFTETGLQKVEITDEQSLTSMDWDIAFRRYVIRINSGNSGPSCVMAARLKEGTVYEDLTAAPMDANYLADEYFSASCELIPDGSGLPGSPATVMSGFWKYAMCVQMSDNVYVLQKADGTKVKITITDYYEPTLQEQCDTMGSVPMGTPGAMIRMRWAFLP